MISKLKWLRSELPLKSPFETLESLPRVPTQIVPIFDNFSDVNKICFHPKIANCPSLLSVACCDEVYLLSYKLEGGLSCRAESVTKSTEVNEFVQNSNSQLLKLKLKYSFSEITTLRSVMKNLEKIVRAGPQNDILGYP